MDSHMMNRPGRLYYLLEINSIPSFRASASPSSF